jgi:imidazolonepropionase-like amidohydrolase
VIAIRPVVASVPHAEVPARGELRIAHAALVEPGAGRRLEQTLTIRGGRIAAVQPSEPDEEAGPWGGLFVMPGLVDLHVHLPPPFLPAELRATLLLFLAHGVTTVRDAGSPWAWSLGTREQVSGGKLPGPRVLSCGPLLVGHESWPGAVLVRSVGDVRGVIERLTRQSVDCVKLLDSVSDEVAAAIREEAHAAGLRVIGHVPSTSDRLLLDEAQHLTGLESAMRTRHPAALAKAVSDSLAEGVSHTPTLVVLGRFARASEGRASCGDGCRYLPRYFQAVLWDPRRIPALEAMVSDLGFSPRERFEAAKIVTRALAAGGVPVLAGTDTPTFFGAPGTSLHEEIALLHEAGLSAEEALAAATTRAGTALGIEGLGRIEAGAPADLLLLRNDPIHAVETGTALDIVAVIAGGRLYSAMALNAALSDHALFFADSVYATATDAVVQAIALLTASRSRSSGPAGRAAGRTRAASCGSRPRRARPRTRSRAARPRPSPS